MTEPMPMAGNWSFPTTIWFGAGSIARLAEACAQCGLKRPMLVTDPALAALPMVAEAVAQLHTAGTPTIVFSDIQSNPVARNVADGVTALAEQNCDGVIAFGGGSALDVGKVIALMARQSLSIWDFEDGRDDWRRANHDGILPVIAVPTTAGTGSETGRAGVITDEENKTKKIIFHPGIMPAIVISDPVLTVGLPPHLTAATGMDALAHCLEAYCAPGFHPFCDGVGLEGMSLVHRYLVRAVEDGGDLEARAGMLAAASMGSTAFQKGLGAIHSLSHPVGSYFNAHHGLTNGVVMPTVLKFNRPAIEERMARLGAYLGLAQAGFDGVLGWIMSLRGRIGIPDSLADLGVEADALAAMAADAAVDPTAATNPRPIDAATCQELYRQALQGNAV